MIKFCVKRESIISEMRSPKVALGGIDYFSIILQMSLNMIYKSSSDTWELLLVFPSHLHPKSVSSFIITIFILDQWVQWYSVTSTSQLWPLCSAMVCLSLSGSQCPSVQNSWQSTTGCSLQGNCCFWSSLEYLLYHPSGRRYSRCPTGGVEENERQRRERDGKGEMEKWKMMCFEIQN